MSMINDWLNFSHGFFLSSLAMALGLVLPVILIVLTALTVWSLVSHDWSWIRDLYELTVGKVIFAIRVVITGLVALFQAWLNLIFAGIGMLSVWMAFHLVTVIWSSAWTKPLLKWLSGSHFVIPVSHAFQLGLSATSAMLVTVVLVFVLMTIVLVLFEISLDDNLGHENLLATIKRNWTKICRGLVASLNEVLADDDEAGKDELQMIREYDRRKSKTS